MRLSKRDRRTRIKNRIRKIISGTESNPRLSVFRSNKEIYAQLIDDSNGKIIAVSSSRDKNIKSDSITRIEVSKLVGLSIGKKAIKAGIEKIGFDRGGYLYHGRVKSFSETLRKNGMEF